MKNPVVILLLFLVFNKIYSQNYDSLTIDDCFKLTRRNAPQLALFDIQTEQAVLEKQRIKSSNLPQVSAYGKAWYQSDAIAVVIPQLPAMGVEVDNFQYNAALNIDQIIYSGGVSKLQKELADIKMKVSGFETEAGLNKLNELVNNYFFGILLLQETCGILELKQKQLDEKLIQIESAVNNGALLPADLYRFKAESLKVTQQIDDVNLKTENLENALRVLIGVDTTISIQLISPDNILVTDTLSRPELQAFKVNRIYLDKASQLQNRRYIPRFSAYGQVGYSYPGLNFFENEPAGFYMAGVKMSWNIFDWKQAKTEKQLLVLSKEQIDVQESDFRRSITIEADKIQTELRHLEKQLAIDNEIIEAYKTATKSSSIALDNGTITSVDYLNDLNSELKACIDQKYHKIEKMKAMSQLAILMGQTGKNFD